MSRYPLKMHFSAFIAPEEQNSDYESGLVSIEGERWRLRTARVTPTKPGAFVAVWRRSEQGSTEPFAAADSTTGLLIFVVDRERRGVFRFTCERLSALGITQSDKHPGKRGFRVYPAWCSGLNPQAVRSQTAQTPAFTHLSPA